MKRILTLLLAIVLILSCLMATGCRRHQTFGRFSYNGKWLTSFAVKDISYSQARNIVSKGSKSALYQNNTPSLLSVDTTSQTIPTPSDALVTSILNKYASVTVITKYYVVNEKKQQTKENIIHGTDLKNALTDNKFVPFSQTVANGIIIFDDLLVFMDEQNTEFKESEKNTVAPFKDIFTYHADSKGHIVIQTHDFVEIPSSVGGGISCSYVQDTEQLYDAENKLVKWQTSLGVYTATAEGTMQQGYILEVEFIWNEKQ